MIATPDRFAELGALVDTMADRELKPEEDARLERLVADDISLRRYYLERVFLVGQLQWEYDVKKRVAPDGKEKEPLAERRILVEVLAEQNATGNEIAQRPRSVPVGKLAECLRWVDPSYRNTRFWTAVTVLTVCFLAALVVLVRKRGPEAEVARSLRENVSPTIARVTGQHQCEWGKGSWRPEYTANLRAGREFELVGGVVEITYDTGARVIVEGPAKCQVNSENAAAIQAGKLTAWVPPAAVGFTVDTPTAKIVDRGTEFGVDVDPRSNAELHVFQGLVEVMLADGRGGFAPAHRVVKNQVVRIDAKQRAVVQQAAGAIHFVRQMPGAPPKSDGLLFEDHFCVVRRLTGWRPTSFGGATGAPQILAVIAEPAANDGKVLELKSDQGATPDQWRGIETVKAFAVPHNAASLQLSGCVQVDHDGQSLASLELVLLGSSGKWMSLRGTANPGPVATTYDWVLVYTDSNGNSTRSERWQGDFTAYRDWVLTVDDRGVNATVIDTDPQKNWGTRVSDLTLAELGSSVRIALRQLTNPAEETNEWITARVDQVTLTAVDKQPTDVGNSEASGGDVRLEK